MPELTLRPQITVVDPDTKIGTVQHVHDYVRLSQGREIIYVQDGYVYYGGGAPVDHASLPTWFWESYRACTPAARKAVGLELPGDSKVMDHPGLLIDSITQFSDLPDYLQTQLLEEVQRRQQAPRMPVEAPQISDEGIDMGDPSDAIPDHPEPSRPSSWSCDQCGESVELRKKGVHIAHHRRAAKVRH